MPRENKHLLKRSGYYLLCVCIGILVHILWISTLSKSKDAPTDPDIVENLTIPGSWHRAPESDKTGPVLTAEQKKIIKQLRSVGYLSGSQPAPKKKNVTLYDKEKAFNGLNLITSGHKPEAILIDMEGSECHKWSLDISRVWPDFEPDEEESNNTYWRRTHLMENGDLLAIFDGIGLIRLDRSSNIIWSVPNGAHHDLHVARNGNIYVLTREAHVNKEYQVDNPILEDYICVLDPNGKELKKISILDALNNSPYAPIIRRLKKWGDILHSNTIEFIEKDVPTSLPFLKKGNLLLSILYPDLVCVFDFKKGIVWAESDLWFRQHQPTLLDNGHILVLDNLGLKTRSRVLELDPESMQIIWKYGGDIHEPFYTKTCGSCQRLPNGNTLITESDPGRAFEVTMDKQIVWEFRNPHRAGKNDELIATLFEVIRLGPDFPMDWLQK